MERDCIFRRDLGRVLQETLKLYPILQSETSGQMVIINRFLNNFVINVDIEPSSRLSRLRHQITSEWRVFECVDEKTSDMRIEKHLICQKVIVRYMEDTDSDILGIGFVITSSIMWISNRGHVFCVRGIRLHPTVVFSNVWMKKKRQSNRKTSEWSKSDCSVRGRYQQRYLVYYKRYRNEFLQRRIWRETVSSDEI